ncbi:hypothetical protein LHYA1_G006740 [Lachnellula hyalina]|uniref:Uncharacterized protein n=1 Tax=Lachnellula hyalina TaxID=1316788 RepID=A0A8H8TZ85_9HELO|nr:uncharacterized protein LHYA1_G006740 [Lachnellula hyalina]TVY24701.1 hypothetical protein LHYA1_G006740 [Lachnellula hyalina]
MPVIDRPDIDLEGMDAWGDNDQTCRCLLSVGPFMMTGRHSSQSATFSIFKRINQQSNLTLHFTPSSTIIVVLLDNSNFAAPTNQTIMCFYEQYQMYCGDYKWGHFRQHCSKEYRTGETCGMKLVMNTITKHEKCKVCSKIDTKKGRLVKEQERIHRWEHEQQRGHHRGASIENSQGIIAQLEWEIQDLQYQRSQATLSTR